MVGFSDLSDDVLVRVLSFLRATDLASAREVDKSVFSARRVSSAIEQLLEEVYNLPLPPQPKRGIGGTATLLNGRQHLYRPDFLFVREITSLLFVMSAPQPPAGKG